MAKKIKRVGLLTAGGLAPCLSSTIGYLIDEYTRVDPSIEIIGYVNGYMGLLKGQYLTVTPEVRKNALVFTEHGGSPIGNSRVKLTNVKDCVKRGLVKEGQDPQKVAADQLVKDGVDVLHTIGGDDTNTAAADLAAFLKENNYDLTVVGLPKTIDNDVYPIAQSLGAWTAAEEGAKYFRNVVKENTCNPRMLIIHEVMGRNCGDIALHTALSCGAELYMIPEIPWSIEEVAERVKWGVMRGKRSMILVFAEGAMSALTTNLEELCAQHEALKDIDVTEIDSHQIARIIEVLSGHETRSTVLGYLQRGGSPSASDRTLGTRLGARAVELLHQDISGVAVGVRGMDLIEVPFADVQKGTHAADTGIADLVDVMAVMTRA